MDDKVNLAEKLSRFDEAFSPRIVGYMNDLKLQVAKTRGEFVWHKHDDTDDLFLCLKGRLTIQLRDRDVVLDEGELFVVPAGVEHCPKADPEARAPDRAARHAEHRRRRRRAHGRGAAHLVAPQPHHHAHRPRGLEADGRDAEGEVAHLARRPRLVARRRRVPAVVLVSRELPKRRRHVALATRDDHYVYFELGHRVEGFVEFESEDQFEPEARRLVTRAAAEITRYRSAIPDLAAAAKILRSEARKRRGWPRWDAAIAFSLLGEDGEAARHFRMVAESEDDRRWWLSIKEAAARLAPLVQADADAVTAEAVGWIEDYRRGLRLPPFDAATLRGG